jgi:hypothetical protein
MSSAMIRSATPSDIPVILRFVRELAEYEREPDAVVATEALLHDALFAPGAVEWSVLDWNTPAIEFYRSVGAVAMDEWTVFRLSGDALARAAEGATRSD